MLNLKEARQKKGMTQTDVAIAVGCSLASYRLWEIGVTTPNADNFKRLTDVLGIKAEDGDSNEAIR